MRIAREIIETLKMELGIIKYKFIDLNLDSKQISLDINIVPSFSGFSFTMPDIKEIALSKNNLKVDSLFQNVDAMIKNFSVSDFKKNIESLYLPNEVTFKSKGIERIVVKFSDVIEKINFQKKEVSIDLLEKKLSISSIETNIILQIKIKNTKLLLKKYISFKSNFLGNLSFCFYLPCEYVEKEKILNAVKALREKYDISKLKFYAYYKDIPLGIAKNIRIANSKKLFVLYDIEKIRKSKGELKNIIVFRYEDKYLYYSV